MVNHQVLPLIIIHNLSCIKKTVDLKIQVRTPTQSPLQTSTLRHFVPALSRCGYKSASGNSNFNQFPKASLFLSFRITWKPPEGTKCISKVILRVEIARLWGSVWDFLGTDGTEVQRPCFLVTVSFKAIYKQQTVLPRRFAAWAACPWCRASFAEW